MYELEVPQTLARLRIECDQALREQVVAGTMTSIHVTGCSFHRHVDDAAFLVGRHRAPRTCRTGVGVGAVEPGFGTEFVALRNGVEAPQHLTRVHVVAADVAGDTFLRYWRTTRGEGRSHHYHISHDHCGRSAAHRRVVLVD